MTIRMRSDLHDILEKFLRDGRNLFFEFLPSDYSGGENPTSLYGDVSVCSDGQTQLNQYEKIGQFEGFSFINDRLWVPLGSSIHPITKMVGRSDANRLRVKDGSLF